MFKVIFKKFLITFLAIALYNHTDPGALNFFAFCCGVFFGLDFVVSFIASLFIRVRAVDMMNDDSLPPHIKEKVEDLKNAMKDHLDKQDEEGK